MTPTTYGRDFAYCLKSHGGVRGFNASLWRFLLRCTLFCHSVATFLTSVSSYEGGCGFEVNLNHNLNHHHRHHPNLYRASTSSCHASTSCRACDACLAFLIHKLHEFRLAIPVFRSCTQGKGGACRVPSYALDTWCKYGEHTHGSPSR